MPKPTDFRESALNQGDNPLRVLRQQKNLDSAVGLATAHLKAVDEAASDVGPDRQTVDYDVGLARLTVPERRQCVIEFDRTTVDQQSNKPLLLQTGEHDLKSPCGFRGRSATGLGRNQRLSRTPGLLL
jgi:hypothetical protein